MTRELAAKALVLFLAAVASWAQFAFATHPPGAPDTFSLITSRVEEVRDSLPAHGVVCFLSDKDPSRPEGWGFWYLAEYSLAPVVLRAGADCGQVVGLFSQPAAAAALVEANGLEIERRYYPDLMLLRRKRP